MVVFLQACAIPYTHLAQVEAEVRDLGFAEVTGDAATRYLGGATGRVWSGTYKARRFVVALRPEILCTVIALDGEAASIKAAVESWLPPSESGVSFKKQTIPAPAPLETTSYELRGGKVRERWVVTTSSDSASQTRAMLSWSRL